MKNMKFTSKNILKFVALSVLFLSLSSTAIARNSCEQLFSKFSSIEIATRRQTVLQTERISVEELLHDLEVNGKLIYKGKHQYVPGTEFLASNEADWLATPFDNKPTDLMIAFGTNSAWEIAINKKPKNLIIGDWSPNPLFAQAYLVGPLLRISKSPTDFILRLAGIEPNETLRHKSLDEIFSLTEQYLRQKDQDRLNNVQIFLKNLAEDSQISLLELKFMTSYFYAMAGINRSPKGMGPFEYLRHPSFANLIGFLKMRYGKYNLIENNSPKLIPLAKQYGALLDQNNFIALKNMYDNNHIKYALTSIDDNGFYQAIATKFSAQTLKNITLSITNIFDCGGYNGLTFQGLQRYLVSTFQTLGRSAQNSMTVFRTASHTPPHGFYRYDLQSPDDIPKLDELESTAEQEVSNIKKAAGF